MSKKFDDDNLEQSGSGIPDAWFLKLTFSLLLTLYLTKTENRTKKSSTQLSHFVLIFLRKNADIRRAVVVKGIFSETTYVCVPD